MVRKVTNELNSISLYIKFSCLYEIYSTWGQSKISKALEN